MKKIYIIRSSYEPNTASIVRCLAFAKGYGELGINTEVVFVLPNSKKQKTEESFENVTFRYLWDKFNFTNRYLTYLFCHVLLLLFVLKLKKDDVVFLYGTINPWYIFFFNKKIKVYNEITEHPSLHLKRKGLSGIRLSLFGRFCKRIDGVFVITSSLKKYFITNFNLDEEKVCIINMVVDSTRFDTLGLREKINTITYCGTISENKDGISDLLQAFKLVSLQYKNISLKLIGCFENSETKKNVTNLLQSLNIFDRVIITGEVDAYKIPLLLSEAKLLVLSRPNNTQAIHGFPTKLGEYLMTENPVILTNVGDFYLFLKDKKNVIFTEPDNVDDFASKMLWALDNYEIAQEIGIEGKKVALKSFNYKIEARRVLEFIKI